MIGVSADIINLTMLDPSESLLILAKRSRAIACRIIL